jgi:hypothetical protein
VRANVTAKSSQITHMFGCLTFDRFLGLSLIVISAYEIISKVEQPFPCCPMQIFWAFGFSFFFFSGSNSPVPFREAMQSDAIISPPSCIFYKRPPFPRTSPTLLSHSSSNLSRHFSPNLRPLRFPLIAQRRIHEIRLEDQQSQVPHERDGVEEIGVAAAGVQP